MSVTAEDLELRINRGETMARFLGDEIIQQVFSTMEELYFKRWKQAETPEQREELRAEARAFEALSRGLQGLVDDGNSATNQLNQRNKSQV